MARRIPETTINELVKNSCGALRIGVMAWIIQTLIFHLNPTSVGDLPFFLICSPYNVTFF
jgi:hypothetical protein